MNDQGLKQFQLWLAIIVGIISFVVAFHNFKNIYLTKKVPEPVTVERTPSPLRTAVEEVGASWLKKFGSPRDVPVHNTTHP